MLQKPSWKGYALNAAIGLQVLFGSCLSAHLISGGISVNTFLTAYTEYLTFWFAMSIIYLLKVAKATTAIGTSSSF